MRLDSEGRIPRSSGLDLWKEALTLEEGKTKTKTKTKNSKVANSNVPTTPWLNTIDHFSTESKKADLLFFFAVNICSTGEHCVTCSGKYLIKYSSRSNVESDWGLHSNTDYSLSDELRDKIIQYSWFWSFPSKQMLHNLLTCCIHLSSPGHHCDVRTIVCQASTLGWFDGETKASKK